VRPALRAEQVAIGGIIGVGKEGLLPAVAALGHVVRDAGNDVASEAGHQAIVAYRAEAVNLVHCHRNPTVTVILVHCHRNPESSGFRRRRDK
jgi:hypothetical protein